LIPHESDVTYTLLFGPLQCSDGYSVVLFEDKLNVSMLR